MAAFKVLRGLTAVTILSMLPVSAYANNITVTIGGAPVTFSASGSCNDQTKCFPLSGSYAGGDITISPLMGSMGPARVLGPVHPVNETSVIDSGVDILRLVNTRITAVNAVNDLEFVIERNHVTGPTSTWYWVYATGSFSTPAPNDKIVVEGKYRVSGGTDQAIGQPLTKVVSCDPAGCNNIVQESDHTSAVVPVSSLGSANRNLKFKFLITLAAGSVLDISGSSGIKVSSGSAPDPGMRPTRVSDLSIFCATTYSTAQSSGCPACVTEDGTVASHARVRHFATMNWERLSQDLARGAGEHASAFASLLGVTPDQQAGFLVSAQGEYLRQAAYGDVGAEQMIAALMGLMADGAASGWNPQRPSRDENLARVAHTDASF